jgi:hypothetical protein
MVWSHIFENLPDAQFLVGGGGPLAAVIANGLVYLPEMNAKKVRIFTIAGRLVTVFPRNEFVMSSVIVAEGELYVSTWNPYAKGGEKGFVQAFAP